MPYTHYSDVCVCSRCRMFVFQLVPNFGPPSYGQVLSFVSHSFIGGETLVFPPMSIREISVLYFHVCRLLWPATRWTENPFLFLCVFSVSGVIYRSWNFGGWMYKNIHWAEPSCCEWAFRKRGQTSARKKHKKKKKTAQKRKNKRRWWWWISCRAALLPRLSTTIKTEIWNADFSFVD